MTVFMLMLVMVVAVCFTLLRELAAQQR